MNSNIEDIKQIRGEVINNTIEIEKLLDLILLAYYCSERSKAKDLHEQIICKTSWRYKLEAFSKIFKKTKPDDVTEGKKAYRKLKSIGEIRDKFAHWRWTFFSEEKIQLNRTDSEFKIFQKEMIDTFHNDAHVMNAFLTDFYFSNFDPFVDKKNI